MEGADFTEIEENYEEFFTSESMLVGKLLEVSLFKIYNTKLWQRRYKSGKKYLL